MPINNRRGHTTLNIQSDPVDHGNDLNNDVQNIENSTNVSVVIDKNTSSNNNPLLDNSRISFSSVKKSRTKRNQVRSYSIAKRIPSTSISRNFSRSMISSLGIRDYSIASLYLSLIHI